MTYPQFKNAIEAVGRKHNWELKLSFATINTEGFKEEDFPLYSKQAEEERVFRMSDALAFQNTVKGG